MSAVHDHDINLIFFLPRILIKLVKQIKANAYFLIYN